MTISSKDTALLAYVETRNPKYYGKILELREAVEGWLAYVPQTFPHYTRHTLQHSDEIVRQASKLLFIDGDPTRPTIALSAIEAYVLVVAAYLHDAGMVAADGEKAEILASEEWHAWTTGDGGGAKRLREIQDLRSGVEPPDDSVRHFLSDIQLRFLIAEFVRRAHHLRVADVIRQHEYSLGRFALDDPVLRRTISDICVAHGLRAHELEDSERYPSRRDIHGEPANVRLLAILLRLSDLLDVSHDRACPLLLNAACPLPADSYAHWAQYQRISHRMTAPDRIELTAECHDQSEHRLLHDWCQWIVDEVEEAQHARIRFARHSDWSAPFVTLEGPDPTILIRPSPTAKYVPSKWVFELDQETVFQRLIFDVYTHPHVFVRELIQNALDATRCQLYGDMREEGLDPPEYPTRVSADRRVRYPIRIRLQRREVTSPLSGEIESRQVLSVEDVGIGMDSEIIERYLLQVGRSYYTTDDFRRKYRFVPASRFGLGFLSVFAVSDEVGIDTYKPGGSQGAPIRLTLTGPKNYLLREQSTRRSRGTRVEVTLREPLEAGLLTNLVSAWCRYVEFPVVVDDLGALSTIEAERPEEHAYEIPDVTTEGSVLAVRAFPVDAPGVQGHIYIFSRKSHDGESWAAWDWARYRYPNTSPQASRPRFPASVKCFHGIAMGEHADAYAGGPVAVRVDYRDEQAKISLSREASWLHPHWGRAFRPTGDPRVDSRLAEILTDHLKTTPRAQGADGWRYKQRLVEGFPLPAFWSGMPGMILVSHQGERSLMALPEAMALPTITVVVNRRSSGAPLPAIQWEIPGDDIEALSNEHRAALFAGRVASSVRWLASGLLAIDWSRGDRGITMDGMNGPVEIVDCPGDYVIGFAAHKTTESVYEAVVLNSRNALVQWLCRVVNACSVGDHGLRSEQAERLLHVTDSPVRYQGHHYATLASYLTGWRTIPDLPPELIPPDLEIQPDMFVMRSARAVQAVRRLQL